MDGTQNFKQSWSSYATGFGDVAKEHWLGKHYTVLKESNIILILPAIGLTTFYKQLAHGRIQSFEETTSAKK